MGIELVPEDVRKLYEVREWKHACAVLKQDFPKEWNDLIEVLRGFRLKRSHMTDPGKNIGPVAKHFNKAFYDRKWAKERFKTVIEVNGQKNETPTHEVDCVKGRVALEIEWSNKDPFFDRDLNNFRLLFELRAISVGVIITKSDDLMDVMKEIWVVTKKGTKTTVWKKYGNSTTWMNQLIPRIEGGGGGGCPILVFGIQAATMSGPTEGTILESEDLNTDDEGAE